MKSTRHIDSEFSQLILTLNPNSLANQYLRNRLRELLRKLNMLGTVSFMMCSLNCSLW